MKKQINIIDLFAGPGGLGEGFYAYPKESDSAFKIRMSVEMEENAHKTLQLRAFYRQFAGNAPAEYYDYVRNPSPKAREALFNKYPEQAQAALEESMYQPRELGNESDDEAIEKKLRQLKKEGGSFVVIGGPPCQAYSRAGESRNKGIKGYKFENDPRSKLYMEYIKVLDIIEPDVFVMENVDNIINKQFDGEDFFPQILEHLKQPRITLGNKKKKLQYDIYSLVVKPDKYENGNPIYDAEHDGKTLKERYSHYVIESENYGIPQSRHRIILLGVKHGINTKPKTLKELTQRTSLGEVIGNMPELRSGLSKKDSADSWYARVNKNSSTLYEDIKSKHLALAKEIRRIKKTRKTNLDRGGEFVPKGYTPSNNYGLRNSKNNGLSNWFIDKKLKGFLNHSTRGHCPEDLMRYLWASAFASIRNKSPVFEDYKDFPEYLAPAHKSWGKGHKDRFRVLLKGSESKTIVSHISKDGHAFIHYDASQCRSLSVREAARIQTFPDNYYFEGGMTAQYVQVGNAVPPYLANQIADIVFTLLRRN